MTTDTGWQLGCLAGRFEQPDPAIFPAPQFAKCSLGVRAVGRSLFLPDIELARSSRNARVAGVFWIFGRPLAVIFENHPDIGQITGRRVRI
jgi:hypothetical protein